MTGRELNDVLEGAGIKRDDLKLINAWACLAPEPRKEVDERKAVECCRPLVQSALSTVPKDTPVMACGKWAMLSLTGREKGLTTRRGFLNEKWQIGDPLKEDVE